MRSVQRSGQQLFGVWPSFPSSTPGYAPCILFKVFHKISFFSYLRYFWLCIMSLFFIQQLPRLASFWLKYSEYSQLFTIPNTILLNNLSHVISWLRPKFHLARLDSTRDERVERFEPCCFNMADDEQAIVLACRSSVVFMLLHTQILFVSSNKIN